MTKKVDGHKNPNIYTSLSVCHDVPNRPRIWPRQAPSGRFWYIMVYLYICMKQYRLLSNSSYTLHTCMPTVRTHNISLMTMIHQKERFVVITLFHLPADTLRNNDVVITSKRGHFDVITSKWRRYDAITTLSLLFTNNHAYASHLTKRLIS